MILQCPLHSSSPGLCVTWSSSRAACVTGGARVGGCRVQGARGLRMDQRSQRLFPAGTCLYRQSGQAGVCSCALGSSLQRLEESLAWSTPCFHRRLAGEVVSALEPCQSEGGDGSVWTLAVSQIPVQKVTSSQLPQVWALRAGLEFSVGGKLLSLRLDISVQTCRKGFRSVSVIMAGVGHMARCPLSSRHGQVSGTLVPWKTPLHQHIAHCLTVGLCGGA